MKWALLGAGPGVWPLVKGVSTSSEHDWTAAHAPRDAWNEISRSAPGLRPLDDWESLIDGAGADVVLVAPAESAEDDQRADQLRRLASARTPVLAVHPVHPSMLLHYELDSLRGEPPSPMAPYMPWRWHPAVVQITRWMESGELGAVEQLIVERAMPRRGRDDLIRQFAVDVDLARLFLGELTHLSAVAPGATLYEQMPRYENLGVQAFGPGDAMLRWSVGPIVDRPGGRFILLAQRGKVTLEAGDDASAWRVELRRRNEAGDWIGEPSTEEFAAVDPFPFAARLVEESLAGRPTSPNWSDAVAAVELAEAIERSLLKRRTIEVRKAAPNEMGIFKTTMTAFGCMLLFFAAPMILLGMIVAAKPFALPMLSRFLVLGGVALLGLFLLLQFLRFLIPAAKAES